MCQTPTNLASADHLLESLKGRNCPHFKDEDTEAQRGKVTSDARQTQEPDSEAGSLFYNFYTKIGR